MPMPTDSSATSCTSHSKPSFAALPAMSAILTGPPSWHLSSRPTAKRFRNWPVRSMIWPVSRTASTTAPAGL